MKLFKSLFGNKKSEDYTYRDFWQWFTKHERTFFNVVKSHEGINEDFFNPLAAELQKLHEGYYYLAGMADDQTAELIITVDGNIKNIVFAEDLVTQAPKLPGWKFTALKPATPGDGQEIQMNDVVFSNRTMHFYPQNDEAFPDEIGITIVHDEFSEENKEVISRGCLIYLDHHLGELNFANLIDHIAVDGSGEHEEIPLAKLKDYLLWRQKEFIEKYEIVERDGTNDRFSSLEANLENGRPLVAILNSTLLEWEHKASHPWILDIEMTYDGDHNNGMPNDKTYKLLDDIEEEITSQLSDEDGYLNIGRQTADNFRNIYFACKEFRQPARVLGTLQKKYQSMQLIQFELYKDKYWKSLDCFRPGPQY